MFMLAIQKLKQCKKQSSINRNNVDYIFRCMAIVKPMAAIFQNGAQTLTLTTVYRNSIKDLHHSLQEVKQNENLTATS